MEAQPQEQIQEAGSVLVEVEEDSQTLEARISEIDSLTSEIRVVSINPVSTVDRLSTTILEVSISKDGTDRLDSIQEVVWDQFLARLPSRVHWPEQRLELSAVCWLLRPEKQSSNR